MKNMKLSELIAHVGNENIKVQRLDSSIVAANNKKHNHTELRIITDTDTFSANDLMAISSGVAPRWHGLIIWIPTDKLP
jgi:hypothetical protein